MNLILIAPPAAGKGTFATMLNEKYGTVSISAGELLRGVDPNTELGKQIREFQSRRELVDDKITNELMKKRLMQDDIKNGFVLDGYPRHMPQVVAIEEIFNELNLKIDYAVLLNVEYDLALKRTLGRQICPNCKQTYNRLTGVNAPKVPNMCNDCNIALVTRNDDNEETFIKGFDNYTKNCLPVVEYYRNKGILLELNSNGTAQGTFEEFEKIIGSK
ncbi:MAG: nucleoside monophosphate kinase [Tenericutes bacterium]|nr:nucleoside monophosphate kinase [Mycoplasmatota bacterium]